MVDKEDRIRILRILLDFNNNPYNFLDKQKLREQFEEIYNEIDENTII